MAAMRIRSGGTELNHCGHNEATKHKPSASSVPANNANNSELTVAARRCLRSFAMKYVFDEGKPKLPSCTIVVTATLMTASWPTPRAPSQRATITPAATLLTIISSRVASVHTTLRENEDSRLNVGLSTAHTRDSNSTTPTSEIPNRVCGCDAPPACRPQIHNQ